MDSRCHSIHIILPDTKSEPTMTSVRDDSEGDKEDDDGQDKSWRPFSSQATVTVTEGDVGWDREDTCRICKARHILPEPGLYTTATPVYMVKRDESLLPVEIVPLADDYRAGLTSPSGDWLAPTLATRAALHRLCLAAAATENRSQLQRFVLEQKNDDGLAALVATLPDAAELCSLLVERFGPFFYDVILAPTIHLALGTEAIVRHKTATGQVNRLPARWAGSLRNIDGAADDLSPHETLDIQPCASCASCVDCVAVAKCMAVSTTARPDHCTPWAELRTLRLFSWNVVAIAGPKVTNATIRKHTPCKTALMLASIVVERIAKRADAEDDWLTRNEAIIEFCVLLSLADTEAVSRCANFYNSQSAMTLATVVHKHCVAMTDSLFDCTLTAESLTMAYALRKTCKRDTVQAPLTGSIAQASQTATHDGVSFVVNVHPPALPVAHLFPGHTSPNPRPERRGVVVVPLDPIVVAGRLKAALDHTAMHANTRLADPDDAGSHAMIKRVWPVSVNRTRRCYSIFRAVGFPATPSPVYVLATLAATWYNTTYNIHDTVSRGHTRQVPRLVFDTMIAPINAMVKAGHIKDIDRLATIELFARAKAPLVVWDGASAVERAIGATLVACFASSGVYSIESATSDRPPVAERPATETNVVVTVAGLIACVAWYVLVYGCVVHTDLMMAEEARKRGTQADRALLAAFDVVLPARLHGSQTDTTLVTFDVDGNGKEMPIVMTYHAHKLSEAVSALVGGALTPRTIACLVSLYGETLRFTLGHTLTIPVDIATAMAPLRPDRVSYVGPVTADSWSMGVDSDACTVNGKALDYAHGETPDVSAPWYGMLTYNLPTSGECLQSLEGEG